MGKILDFIGSLYPGYTGYRNKEQRRDVDRLLRDAIMKRLLDRKQVLDGLIADATRTRKYDLVPKMETLKNEIQAVADKIKHAVRGYSGFFDTVQVKEEDLDRLYRYDLGVHEKAEAFTKLMSGLRGGPGLAEACDGVQSSLRDLEDAVNERSNALMGVK